MLTDARQLPADTTIESDVCIVGSGPAGLTIARELSGRGLRIALLESGGRDFEAAYQQLNEGQVSGDPYYPLEVTRRRQLGGTAQILNSVSGDDFISFRCGPMYPIDLERREGFRHSGWPVDLHHLDPFYRRAQVACGLGAYQYEGEAWSEPGAQPFSSPDDTLGTTVWQFADAAAFTRVAPEAVISAPDVDAYVHASVVELLTDETGQHVTALRIRCLDGKELTARARAYVLAGGGIENPRLLLLSRAVHAAGIGNEHDLVGRFFMEHPVVRCGTLTPDDRDLFNRASLYGMRRVNGTWVVGKLRLSEEVLRREKLLNLSALLLPRHPLHDRFRQESVDSLAALLSGARHLRLPSSAGKHLWNVITGLDYVAAVTARKLSRGALFRYWMPGPTLLGGRPWADLPDKDRRYTHFEVLLHTEQAPDPGNRVRLSDQKDALGVPKAHLEWRWDETSIDNVRRAEAALAREFARAGLGRLDIDVEDGRPHLVIPGLNHHIGTTRMHEDPRHGVVDANARVHGVSNLFVAGSSVFPTGGYINVTLTIVALAIRLADHLKTVLTDTAFNAPSQHIEV